MTENGYGGLLYVNSEGVDIIVDGGTYNNVQAYSGGLIYCITTASIPNKESSITFTNDV